MLAGNAAEPLLALGQWSRAAAMIDRALELDPPPHHIAHLRLLQAWLRVWRGELDEADVILREFRPMITADNQAPQYVSQIIRADAEHAMAVGDPERAWRDVSVFLDSWDRYHGAWAYPVLAVAAAAARALDAAEGSLRTLRSCGGLPGAARPADQHPAAVGAVDHRRAGGHCRRLAQRAGRADRAAGPGPPAAVRRAAAGPAPGRRPGTGRGAGRARPATEQAATLGARLLTDRLGALAQRAGFAPAAEVGSSPLAGLTPREIEVLQLVAAGNSNGEIGSALFISTKTASVHVSNILAKLGVSGRGEAAALAYKLGLVSV